jgi:hypothetical protein
MSVGIPVWIGSNSASAYKNPLVSMMYRFYKLEFKLPQPLSATEPISVTLTEAAKKLGNKPVTLYPFRIHPCGERATK